MTQFLILQTTLRKYDKKETTDKKPGRFKLEKLPVRSVQTTNIIFTFIVNTLLIEKTIIKYILKYIN